MTLFIRHLNTKTWDELNETCFQAFIPCFTLYSSFGTEFASSYGLYLFIFILIGSIASIVRFAMFDYKSRYDQLFYDEKYFISRKIFNAWEWNIKKEHIGKDILQSVELEIDFFLHRDTILQKIKERKTFEKCMLTLRRLISVTLNIALLLGAIYTIIKIQDLENDLVIESEKYLEEWGLEDAKGITGLIPSLAISIFNATIPTITRALVLFEKWDFPEFSIKQEIWRNYIQKFINLTIFTILSYDGVYDITWFDEYLGTNFKSKVGHSDESKVCKYDKAGIALAQLALTELVVMPIVQTAALVGRFFFFGLILRKKDWKDPKEKHLSKFVIWMLYNKAVQWLTILQLPYFLLLSPIIDYIGFQIISFQMIYFYRKGSPASSDIALFLMTMMNTTFFYCQVMMGPWFIFERDHNCGPIENGQSGWEPVIADIQERPFIKAIYFFFSFFPALWIILSVLILNVFLRSNKSDIIEQYSNSKTEEYLQQIQDQGNVIRRLKQKIEFNKKL